MNNDFSRTALHLLAQKKPDAMTPHTKNRVIFPDVNVFVSEWKHDADYLGVPCTRCEKVTANYFSIHVGNIHFIICRPCFTESTTEVIQL